MLLFLLIPSISLSDDDLLGRIERLENKISLIESRLSASPEKKSIGDYKLSDEAFAYRDNIEITDFTLKSLEDDNGEKYAGAIFKMKNNGDRDIKVLAVTAYFLDKDGKRIQEFFIPAVTPKNRAKPLFKAGYVWETHEGFYFKFRDKIPTGWDEGQSEHEITYIDFVE